MDHVAILKKKWKLIDLILAGTKTIESRWYKSKVTPWNRIKAGEKIYFKNSGEPVSAKADVTKVLQFDLNHTKVNDILKKYGKAIGIDNIPDSAAMKKDKKYCILIFLKNAKKIQPFDIDKTGFGLMAAWITVNDIKKLKKTY